MRDTGIRRKDKRKAKGLSRSRGRPSQPKDVKAGKSSKTGSKTRASKPYWKMTTAELREATKEFDQECRSEPVSGAVLVSAPARRPSASRWKSGFWPKPINSPRSFAFPGPC